VGAEEKDAYGGKLLHEIHRQYRISLPVQPLPEESGFDSRLVFIEEISAGHQVTHTWIYTSTLNFSASVFLGVLASRTPNPILKYGARCLCEGVKTCPFLLLCILHRKNLGSNFNSLPSVSINAADGLPCDSTIYSRTWPCSARLFLPTKVFRSSSLYMSSWRFKFPSFETSSTDMMTPSCAYDPPPWPPR
jgi:hypothetical protein